MDYKEKVIAPLNSQELSDEQIRKLEVSFPELAESEDERIRKSIINLVDTEFGDRFPFDGFTREQMLAWLEKQGKKKPTIEMKSAEESLGIDSNTYNEIVDECVYGEQKPAMIQWKGNNLKEVIDFTGIYKDGFEKWFHNSWEEYEKYVHEHNNIFKIFNKDGSHIEVPVGAWIVKTPDGYNTASRYVFRQKSEWSEEDEKKINNILNVLIDYKELESEYYWLKSLRPQSHWKPTNEQIGMVTRVCNNLHIKNSEDIKGMDELLSQLERLYLNSPEVEKKKVWKPSDEQIKGIECAIKTLRHQLNVGDKRLNSLYDDLKKLREG